MKLEQTLEMYRPSVQTERQQVYTTVDLESLSATVLYTGPLGDSLGGGFASADFGEMREVKDLAVPSEAFVDISKLPTVPVKYSENFGNGVSLGESFGKSLDYIKDTSLGQLHVHAPKDFITGAKLDGKRISNYEAAMIDLLPGKVSKDTKKW